LAQAKDVIGLSTYATSATEKLPFPLRFFGSIATGLALGLADVLFDTHQHAPTLTKIGVVVLWAVGMVVFALLYRLITRILPTSAAYTGIAVIVIAYGLVIKHDSWNAWLVYVEPAVLLVGIMADWVVFAARLKKFAGQTQRPGH